MDPSARTTVIPSAPHLPRRAPTLRAPTLSSTPSFTPQESAAILQTSKRLTDHIRAYTHPSKPQVWIFVVAALAVVAWAVLWLGNKHIDKQGYPTLRDGLGHSFTLGMTDDPVSSVPTLSVSPPLVGDASSLLDASQTQTLFHFSTEPGTPLVCNNSKEDHVAMMASYLADNDLSPFNYRLVKRLAATPVYEGLTLTAPLRQRVLWLTPYGLIITDERLGSSRVAGVLGADQGVGTPLGLPAGSEASTSFVNSLPSAFWNMTDGRLNPLNDQSWPLEPTTNSLPVLWRLRKGRRQLQFLRNGDLRLVNYVGDVPTVLWTASNDIRSGATNASVNMCASAQ